jgi:hypothetical protein
LKKHPCDAIAEFRKADQKADGPPGSDVLPLYFNLGRAFDAANEADSAIVMFEKSRAAIVALEAAHRRAARIGDGWLFPSRPIPRSRFAEICCVIGGAGWKQ